MMVKQDEGGSIFFCGREYDVIHYTLEIDRGIEQSIAHGRLAVTLAVANVLNIGDVFYANLREGFELDGAVVSDVLYRSAGSGGQTGEIEFVGAELTIIPADPWGDTVELIEEVLSDG